MIAEHVKLAGDGFLELSDDRLKILIKSEPISDIYHVDQTPFARGKFASVRRLVHKVSGVPFAGKFIRRRRRAADTSREISHEIAVLDLCSGSDRVVRLVEVYETRAEVALVLELATGGELQHILDEEERLSESDARRALRHTLRGLRDLHAHNVAHLDLKPQNLLVCNNENGDGSKTILGEVKLCDFGISRLIQPGVEVREIMGTPDYVAPEVLQYERLSLATDIWSVGVLAYVLLSGFSPFAGDSKQETYLNITQNELGFPQDLFNDVSETAKDFVRSCLVLHPSSRPTVEQCLEHPWLSESSKIDVDKSLIVSTLEDKAQTDSSLREENSSKHEASDDKENHKKNGFLNSDDADSKDLEDKIQIPEIITKASVYISFPDAPTTPKVSRKSHLAANTVLSLCKKFQQDTTDNVMIKNHEDDENPSTTEVEDNNENEINEDNLSLGKFDNSVTYTMTCLLCSQCGGQCCHIPRKSLTLERGIIC